MACVGSAKSCHLELSYLFIVIIHIQHPWKKMDFCNRRGLSVLSNLSPAYRMDQKKSLQCSQTHFVRWDLNKFGARNT